jgi:mannose-6-phosphate isomerase-like protein (cupin superfamily)
MSRDKEWRFARIEAEARGFDLEVEAVVKDKPWGGYVSFSRHSLAGFRDAYWRGFLSEHWQQELDNYFRAAAETKGGVSLDAKLLLVAPGERISLQAHRRRSELWRIVEGPIVFVSGTGLLSLSDREVRPGEVLKIPCGTLHRLTAPAPSWGVVAEFWHHEDPPNPSDEDDIVRYDDDYQERHEGGEGRTGRPQ